MDHEGDVPPAFWSRPPATIQRRRRPSSTTLNPVAMIILVPILALLVIVFILIPLLSNASQFLKTPNSLKKSWDSLNIVLVLFAILCGVFLRQNNDDASVSTAAETLNNPVTENVSSSTSASQWFDDFNDQKMYNNPSARALETGSGKLMRSSSSYPDLRQHESLWQSRDRPYRFYDDFDLNIYHRSPPETDDSDIKVISVDTFVSSSPPPAGMTSAALPMSSESGPKPQQEDSPRQQRKDEPKDDSPQVPLQKPESVKMKRRRSVRNSSKRANIKRPSEIDHLNKIETSRSPPSPPPLAAAPPPPPPPPLPQRQEKCEMLERKPLPPPPPPPPPRHQEKSKILQGKKSGATKEIATAIASLYNRTKKKKPKIRNIYDNATTSPPPPNSSIPPPPPPPPPPSVFHNMFRKEHKNKKIHSISSSVQSQPPSHTQPPNSIFNNIFKNSSKSKRFNSTSIPAPPPPPPLPQLSILNNLYKPATTSKRFYSTSSSHSHHGKPPLSTKTNSYYGNIGSQSPVMPIPPPPPPPPFKMQQVKFKARGDFVRIKSGHGSRSSSPELEDVEVASTRESPRAENGEANMGSSVFCPSPDVNTKADNFIARLRDEWRLEKMNSIRAKQ